MGSKCAVCDERNATIYDAEADDMYCGGCYEQKRYEEDVCYCGEYSTCVPCIERGKSPC
jgi:hypothetical protein